MTSTSTTMLVEVLGALPPKRRKATVPVSSPLRVYVIQAIKCYPKAVMFATPLSTEKPEEGPSPYSAFLRDLVRAAQQENVALKVRQVPTDTPGLVKVAFTATPRLDTDGKSEADKSPVVDDKVKNKANETGSRTMGPSPVVRVK